MNSFEENFQRWLDGVASELTYWNNDMLNKGGIFCSGFSMATSRDRRFNLEEDLPIESYGKDYKVIEVGSGPYGSCGLVTDKVNLNLVAVDPLASAYKTLKEKYGIDNGLKLETGFVELLNHKYAENSFDMVYMRNALDHCFDPIFGLYQLLYICRIGGKVVLMHDENEAEHANYDGFHQWNLSCRDGMFTIWRPGIEYDVAAILGDMVEVSVTPLGMNYDQPMNKVVIIKNEGVELPVNSFYENIFERIYATLLEKLLQYEVQDNNFWATDLGKIFKKLEIAYQDAEIFGNVARRLSQYNSVVIYGASVLGRKLFDIMKKYGINIKCIIDKRAQIVDDMEAITLAQYVSDEGDLIIIASSRFADDIKKDLSKAKVVSDVVCVDELFS